MGCDEVILSLEESPTGSEASEGGLFLAGARLRASETIPGLPLAGSVAGFDAGASGENSARAGQELPGCPLRALLGEEETLVDCRFSAEGITVRAAGFGEVLVAADGRRIVWRPLDDLSRHRPELVLGPGLVLALALQGVFCLHASAVLGHSGAVVFAGSSGAGKSTLAARLGEQHGFQRLTDDITPLAPGGFVLPHFPQLKLPPESQHPAEAPTRYPLSRLYLLAECEADVPALAEDVSPSTAALSLCGHAVASRLFPEPLLADLFQATAALVESVEVRRLRYPKRPGSVAEVARLLATA